MDTGSSELYFDASSAPVCQTQGCKGGTFDPSKSSSYQEVAAAPAFRASFVDGTMAVGPYAIDVIGIGNKQVSPVQFGVANEVKSRTKSEAGVMGRSFLFEGHLHNVDTKLNDISGCSKNISKMHNGNDVADNV